MAERAAHLVDHVFPDVPVRQWVLSLPYRLRYRLAWDHDLCRAVVAVYRRAVLGWLRRRAQLDDVADGRGGAVAVLQRFGGALNLNVHIHALVLDGVFAKDESGTLVFYPTPHLTALDVAEVLATVEPRIARLLNRRGLGERDDSAGEADGSTSEAPVLAGLAAASVQGLVALGRQRGARIRRLGDPSGKIEARCHARSNGFDLHAGLVVPVGQRERLDQVCRYALRPPVARERLSVTGAGQVRLQLRQPWAGGTTRLVFDPVEFLGRLAVLVPRPRINLVLYHGVLGPRAAWRAAVVPREAAPQGEGEARTEDLCGQAGHGEADASTPDAAQRRARGRLWAELMQRTFNFDVLACPRCGGRLRLIALIDQVPIIQQILRHLGLPSEIPTPTSVRAPPLMNDGPATFDPGC